MRKHIKFCTPSHESLGKSTAKYCIEGNFHDFCDQTPRKFVPPKIADELRKPSTVRLSHRELGLHWPEAWIQQHVLDLLLKDGGQTTCSESAHIPESQFTSVECWKNKSLHYYSSHTTTTFLVVVVCELLFFQHSTDVNWLSRIRADSEHIVWPPSFKRRSKTSLNLNFCHYVVCRLHKVVLYGWWELHRLLATTVAVNKKFMYRTSSTYVVRINPSPYHRRTLCVQFLCTV